MKNFKHPSNQPPQSVCNLSGSFWGLAVFFNPAGYKSKKKNYQIFQNSVKSQGLKLLTVELAFGDDDFELNENDADILIQLKTKDILWQKERLLNIGLDNLPDDCDKIAWLDADIIFDDNDWVAKASELLKKYKVVQPFSWVVRLPKGKKDIDLTQITIGRNEGCKFYGLAYGVAHYGKNILTDHMRHGYSGYGWTARRDVFSGIGFYDRLIVGGGDLLMAHAFFGDPSNFIGNFFGQKFGRNQNQWMDNIFKEVQGSVAYLDGVVMHLWHGSRQNRFYGERKKIEFDPDQDIELSDGGCWQFTKNNLDLPRLIRNYFHLRREDGQSEEKNTLSVEGSAILQSEKQVVSKIKPNNDWASAQIKKVVRGKTFADVGGLWNTVKERVSVAHLAGAKSTAMIDMASEKSEMWRQFDRRCQKLGVKCNKKIVANTDEENFTKKVGLYEVVSCSGVLYHCPNPEHTIKQLSKITQEYLIFGTTVIPDVINNQKGKIKVEKNGFLKAENLNKRQRQIINQHFAKVGVKEVIKEDNKWSLSTPSYAPWWYFFTKNYVASLLEKNGFKIVDYTPEWNGRSAYFLAKKKKNKLKLLTRDEFKKMERDHPGPYYYKRWDYIKEVIDIIEKEDISRVLEIGPLKKTIVKGSDVMDLMCFNKNITYYHDATKVPWPILDKQYDLLIALQVWEHLKDKQQLAFKEVVRVAKSAILSFPLNWHCPGDCHHNITEKKISKWTLGIRPVKKIIVKSKSAAPDGRLVERIVYFYKFNSSEPINPVCASDKKFASPRTLETKPVKKIIVKSKSATPDDRLVDKRVYDYKFNSSEPINLVCASDKKFASPLLVMLKSVIVNLKDSQKIDIFILNSGLRKKDKARISTLIELDRVNIEFIDIDYKIFKGMRVDGHISAASYYRLLIPDLLPSEIKKVIYLDSDLIVNRDLADLWRQDVASDHLLAVPCRYAYSALEKYKELGFSREDKYFNAGVLLINVEKWREDKISQKALSFARQHRPRWHDQDALNVVLRGRWRALDPRWNVVAPLYLIWPEKLDAQCQDKFLQAYSDYPIKNLKEREKIATDPFIMHFTTPIKPWQKNANPPNKSLYIHYQNMITPGHKVKKHFIKKDWQRGKKNELQFWQHSIRTGGYKWPQVFLDKLNPDLPLQNYIKKYLNPDQAEVFILDVGAGPMTKVGKKWPGHTINIVAVDALADQFSEVLANHKIIPPVVTQYCLTEELTKKFKKNQFDLVHAINTLDHGYDILQSFQQMIKVVKRGGYVVTVHYENEAKNRNYQGMHQWNLFIDNGNFMAENKEIRINLTQKIKRLAKMTELSLSQGGFITAVFKKK